MVDQVIETVVKYDGKAWKRRTGITKGKTSWIIDSEIVPNPDKHESLNVQLLKKICDKLGISY